MNVNSLTVDNELLSGRVDWLRDVDDDIYRRTMELLQRKLSNANIITLQGAASQDVLVYTADNVIYGVMLYGRDDNHRVDFVSTDSLMRLTELQVARVIKSLLNTLAKWRPFDYGHGKITIADDVVSEFPDLVDGNLCYIKGMANRCNVADGSLPIDQRRFYRYRVDAGVHVLLHRR